MPFDGVDHRGARFIPAYAWHPESIASGGCLSSALAASYAVSRHHATNIGTQTYYFGAFLEGSDFIDLAQWRRYLPEHVTHVVCESRFIFSDLAEDGKVSHRVKVKVGSTTDNGATVSEEIDSDLIRPTQRSAGANVSTDAQVSRCFVELSSVASLLPSQSAVITASAFAEDSEGNAAWYRPISVSAWWVSIG